ncbi:MAG: hypothetical protein DMG11_21480 [Acidobacteria bacterium]|nr:MAG: hypothetical protein DMG11_21480 [Acidobacteriota bacterium]
MSRITPVVLLLMFPIVAAHKASVHWSWMLMAGHVVLLLAGALLCHSALASRRPDPQHLTEYYFWIALGGALGGIFTAVIAPFIFTTVLEYPLLVAVIAFFRVVPNKEEKVDLRDGIYLAGLVAALAFIWILFRWTKIDITESVKTSAAANVGFALVVYSFREHPDCRLLHRPASPARR